MLGFLVNDGQGGLDALLADAAARLGADGLRVAGALQQNQEVAPDRPCRMMLAVLGSDRVVAISQDLGRDATGCRLDPQGLAAAVALVEAGMARAAPDLLIVNKFGKSEAEGRGFRDLIGKALADGIPVLTTVSAIQHPAFLDFAGDMATELPAELQAITAWHSALREVKV